MVFYAHMLDGCLQVLSVLKLEKGAQMPEDYPKSFREAVAVFQHAQMSVKLSFL